MNISLKILRLSAFTDYVLKASGLFIAYLLSALAGLTFDAVSGFAALIWIPTGLSLAVLLLFGSKFWPSVFMAAYLANWQTGASLVSAFFIATGNTLEALIAVYLLKVFTEFRPDISRLKDALSLIIVCAFASLISATIGVTSLLIDDVVTRNTFMETWSAWWIGDLVSGLVIAPLILVLSQTKRVSFSTKNLIDFLFVLILIATVSYILFFGFLKSEQDFPATYIIFPPLIISTIRFGQKGAVTSTFLITSIATVATVFGLGPFINESQAQSLFFLQSFMIIVATTNLVLGATQSERVELEKRRTNFISIASHEFKTPIATISSYVELLETLFKENKRSKQFIYTSRLKDQVDRLLILVNDLLDVSKIQTGKLVIEEERFSFDKFIRQVVTDMQKTANRKITLEGNIKTYIWADRNRLYQVVTNLLSNAIKFSPNSKSVKVKVVPTNKALKVSVQDFGMGINKENKDKVFERLYQEESTSRPSFGGLGLGLYISKEIIKLHKGKIWLTSRKGRGTVFSFKLPLRKH